MVSTFYYSYYRLQQFTTKFILLKLALHLRLSLEYFSTTQKITLQNDPSKRPPLIHAHKAQGRAEIKIIRFLKRLKTEFWSSKLVRFSNKISNANISTPRIDNP